MICTFEFWKEKLDLHTGKFMKSLIFSFTSQLSQIQTDSFTSNLSMIYFRCISTLIRPNFVSWYVKARSSRGILNLKRSKRIQMDFENINHLNYHKVASSNTSRLEAHAGFFGLLMKGICDPYVLWPFDKKLIF